MTNHPGCTEKLASGQSALTIRGLSAVVCTHKLHVQLLSRFSPVAGATVAITASEPPSQR